MIKTLLNQKKKKQTDPKTAEEKRMQYNQKMTEEKKTISSNYC